MVGVVVIRMKWVCTSIIIIIIIIIFIIIMGGKNTYSSEGYQIIQD